MIELIQIRLQFSRRKTLSIKIANCAENRQVSRVVRVRALYESPFIQSTNANPNSNYAKNQGFYARIAVLIESGFCAIRVVRY